MNVLIVIPVFNEGKNILILKEELETLEHDYIIVNDGSIDETDGLLTVSGANFISQTKNLGQGAALRAGMDFGLEKSYDLFVHFDGDGQHDIKDIQKLILAFKTQELDIVFGSRFLTKESLEKIPNLRAWILRFARIFQNFITGVKLSDVHCGLRVLSSETYQKMNLTADRMAHATEYVMEVKRLNLKFKEVPVNVNYTFIQEGKEGIPLRIYSVLKELVSIYILKKG